MSAAIYKARFPSMELHAFRRHDLWLRAPDVWHAPDCEDEIDCSGMYCWPTEKETLVVGRPIDLSKGAIVIAADGATLAHEWRHHWQRYQWHEEMCRMGKNFWSTPSTMREYKKAIIEYFVDTPSELDALGYELNHKPTDDVLQWAEWISQHEREKLHGITQSADATTW